MINQQLLNPKSIVVIGGSNNVHKPGGAIVRNIKNGGFDGPLHIVNPKEDEVQGIKAYHDVKDIPNTDLARRPRQVPNWNSASWIRAKSSEQHSLVLTVSAC